MPVIVLRVMPLILIHLGLYLWLVVDFFPFFLIVPS